MSAPAVKPEKASYSLSAGYLRAFVTLLVLAHHSFLAYCSFTPAPPASLIAQPRWWEAFPVADTAHWPGFDLIVGFNDIFFMSLMFFLSGLFVWKSLTRKGAGQFASDRWGRLGVPFFAAGRDCLATGVLGDLCTNQRACEHRRIRQGVAVAG